MELTLLGGGKLLLKIAEKYANSQEFERINIITSKRHSTEQINKIYFKDECQRIKESASEEKISFHILDNLDNPQFQEICVKSNLAISFGAAWIFKKKHIEICKNLVNIHCTPLPMWRGGGGMSWMILAGINYSNINIHLIDEGVDTGDILFSKRFFFPIECKTPKDRNDFTHKLSLDHLNSFIIEFVKKGHLPTKSKQQQDFSSYFPRLNSSIHGCIDWSWDSNSIVRFIDAFDDPYCGAFSNLSDTKGKVFLKKAILLEGEFNFHPYQSGIVYRRDDKGIYICGNKGSIYCTSLKNFGGENIMNEISLGDRFYTTYNDLEKARSTKSIYNSSGVININNEH